MGWMEWLILISAILAILADGRTIVILIARLLEHGFTRKALYLALLVMILTIISGIAIAGVHGVLTCHLDGFWYYKIGQKLLDEGFKIDAIKDKCNRDLEKSGGFSYAFGIPLSISGTTTFPESTKVWVILRDRHDLCYLQWPLLDIKGDRWRATNIRPRSKVTGISWFKVVIGGQADELFENQKDSPDPWGGFPCGNIHSGFTRIGWIELEQ